MSLLLMIPIMVGWWEPRLLYLKLQMVAIVGQKKLLILVTKKYPLVGLVSLEKKVGLSVSLLFFYILTMAAQVGHELL